MEYSIGDLSKISRVSGRTLHQYHLQGLVVPTRIDKFSSHRFYDEKCLHRVEIVNRLRNLGVPLDPLKDLLTKHKDYKNMMKHLQSGYSETDPHWAKIGLSREKIETILRGDSLPPVQVGDLQIKTVPEVFIAYERFHGKMEDIFKRYENLMKTFGTIKNGPAFTLYLDDHQYEEEMDVECCLPVKQKIPVSGLRFRHLPGAKVVSVMYEGNFNKIWMGYQKIIDYLNKERLAIQSPSREVYLRGEGNLYSEESADFLTEIEFVISDGNDPSNTREVFKPGYGFKFDL